MWLPVLVCFVSSYLLLEGHLPRAGFMRFLLHGTEQAEFQPEALRILYLTADREAPLCSGSCSLSSVARDCVSVMLPKHEDGGSFDTGGKPQWPHSSCVISSFQNI